MEVLHHGVYGDGVLSSGAVRDAPLRVNGWADEDPMSRFAPRSTGRMRYAKPGKRDGTSVNLVSRGHGAQTFIVFIDSVLPSHCNSFRVGRADAYPPRFRRDDGTGL